MFKKKKKDERSKRGIHIIIEREEDQRETSPRERGERVVAFFKDKFQTPLLPDHFAVLIIFFAIIIMFSFFINAYLHFNFDLILKLKVYYYIYYINHLILCLANGLTDLIYTITVIITTSNNCWKLIKTLL